MSLLNYLPYATSRLSALRVLHGVPYSPNLSTRLHALSIACDITIMHSKKPTTFITKTIIIGNG